MNSVFEKHLKNATFKQDILKLETLEDKIAFCKKFLEDNNALPEKKDIMKPYQEQFIKQYYTQKPIESSVTPIYAETTITHEMLQDQRIEADRIARKDICYSLLDQILIKGLIEWEESQDCYNETTKIRGKLKVIK